MLTTPTPSGPKFPESGDLAGALLPGLAGGALGPPTPGPGASPGRPRSVVISADRRILLRGSVSHLNVKLVGTTVCMSRRWAEDEAPKSTRFWSIPKVICGLEKSKFRGRSQSLTQAPQNQSRIGFISKVIQQKVNWKVLTFSGQNQEVGATVCSLPLLRW